jgi:flavin-dependent dehydrogenase
VTLQAVIGAGAAGLVAARELCREGLQVVVFEQVTLANNLIFHHQI